jgi:lysine-specific demethylase 8
VSCWSPAYLTQKLGPVEIECKLSATNQHPNFRASGLKETFARERTTLGAFLHAVTEGPAAERPRRLFTGDERFLLQRRNGQIKKDPALAGLLDDVQLPSYLPEPQLYTIWGWFSGAGVRTWLHYDNNGCHNLNAQLTGQKRCLLFPPHELRRLAPFPLGGGNPAYNCSRIDVDGPGDGEAAGLLQSFREAEAFAAELRAGDLLFIPAWWFHTFFHLGQFNSNVNFWWKPERPRLNPVAARQALLDAAAAAAIEAPAGSREAAVLAALDRALVDRG